MDAFGIGAAVRGAFEVMMRTMRGTGRTTALLESLQDGDRVVFLTQAEARRFEHMYEEMCRQKGITATVRFIVRDAGNFAGVYEHGSSKGRTVFDHTWVEAYYRDVLALAAEQIDYHQRELSGRGMAHVETRLAARELSRWK